MSPEDPKKGKAEKAEAETVTDATEQTPEAAGDAPAKPRRTRRKAAEPKAEEASGQAAEPGEDDAKAEPAADEEPVAEPKPKRSRARKAPAEEAPAEAAEPQPERRRDAGEPVVVRAQAKYVRTSARKARLVCDHIRGKDVEEARAILAFTARDAARAWAKLLDSAVANAEHNHELVGEDLRVQQVWADEGPTLKRFRPRAMGRATRIRKRTSHLTIMLAPKQGAKGGR